MIFKFFNPRPDTLDEGKALYRRLAAQYHPDHGGSTEAMQQINAEWDALKDKLPRFVSKQAKEGRKAYEAKRSSKAREINPEVDQMAEKLSKMGGLQFDVVGSWIWTKSNYRYTIKLQEMGFQWSANRKMYYWHPAGEESGRARKSSYTHIYNKYEGQSYRGESAEELAS